jgi:2-polyprenyl-3-methyl-5-hydroxy-6-metoxy-1,4-benzoquinol methylase
MHFGVTGETGRPLESLVAQAPHGFHAALTETAERCIGIDINAEAIKAIAEAGIFDNAIVADARTVRRDQIPLDRIDLIVAGDIIEHLSDPGALLDNAARLSDPGTRLALTTPNAVGLAAFLRYFRGGTLEGDAHVVSFNRYSLGNLLQQHGWTVDAWATCHQLQAAERHRVTFRLGRWLFRRWPYLGGTLVAVAHHPS